MVCCIPVSGYRNKAREKWLCNRDRPTVDTSLIASSFPDNTSLCVFNYITDNSRGKVLNVLLDSLDRDEPLSSECTAVLLLATLFSLEYGYGLRLMTRKKAYLSAYSRLLARYRLPEPDHVESYLGYEEVQSLGLRSLEIGMKEVFLVHGEVVGRDMAFNNLAGRFFYIPEAGAPFTSALKTISMKRYDDFMETVKSGSFEGNTFWEAYVESSPSLLLPEERISELQHDIPASYSAFFNKALAYMNNSISIR